MDPITAALRREPPDRVELLAALATVPRLRADLDAAERLLIDTARATGASWAAIAGALGLGSRQAAEQRWLRLAALPAQAGRDPVLVRRARTRQQTVDKQAGQIVADLRSAVRELAAALDRHAAADHDPPAVLARQTLTIALDATPGSLVDLAKLALTDLAASQGVPAAVAPAVHRVTALLAALADTRH
jgi:hypothetical protein